MNRRSEVLRAYLVDDETLALKRLRRLLGEAGQIEILGSATDPSTALKELLRHTVDVLFLDIEMPGMSGFELLKKLPTQPFVVFTTAYDQYALRAFEVNSIDYLLKPVDSELLNRALTKLRKLRAAGQDQEFQAQLRSAIEKVAASLHAQKAGARVRIASRLGDRIVFLELGNISHFFSKDKLTFAATAEKDYVVDHTLTDLEQKLDPSQFVRIHRSALVNLSFVAELHSWFAGKLKLRLKDKKHTELTVARERTRELKERLGLETF